MRACVCHKSCHVSLFYFCLIALRHHIFQRKTSFEIVDQGPVFHENGRSVTSEDPSAFSRVAHTSFIPPVFFLWDTISSRAA